MPRGAKRHHGVAFPVAATGYRRSTFRARQFGIRLRSFWCLGGWSPDQVLPLMRRSSPIGMIQPPARSDRAEFIRTPRLDHAGAHSLRFRVDGRADEVALDSDEDGAEVEAGERLLIGWRNVGFSDRSRTGDDATDQPTQCGCLLHLPYRRQHPAAPWRARGRPGAFAGMADG